MPRQPDEANLRTGGNDAPALPERCARLLAVAARDPRRAAALVLACLAPADDPWAHYTLGLVLLRWERAALARPHLEAACAALGPAAPACAIGLLMARQLSGEGDSLQPAWSELAGALERAGQPAAAARARNEQIANLNVLGEHPRAAELAGANAAAVAAHGDPADAARLDFVAGVAAGGLGDVRAADAALGRALERYRQLRRPVDAARVLFERSWLRQRGEQFAAARADLERALATFRRFDMPLRVAYCQKDLALALCRTGDYPGAIAYAEQAYAGAVALGRRDIAAYCDHILGMVAQYAGLADLALAAYGRAQAVYWELGKRRFWLTCERNRAMLLAAQGRPAAALALLDAIEAPLRELGDQLEIAELLAARARALRDLGREPAALAELEAARGLFLRHGNQAAAAECRLDLGWAELGAGRPAAAEAQLLAAWPVLDEQPAHRWRLSYGLGRVAAARGEAAAALAHYHDAAATVAALRQRLVSEHASSGIFLQARPLYADAATLAARAGAPERLAELMQLQRALAVQRQLADPFAAPPAAQARQDAARRQLQAAAAADGSGPAVDRALQEYVGLLLRSRHRAPAEPAPTEPFDLSALRERLGQAHGHDWSMIAPLIVDDQLLLLLIDMERIELAAAPYDAATQALVELACLPRYRLETYRDLPFLRGEAARPWATLRELAERLLPPQLRRRLHPGHRLLIVPSGPLHALAWGALRLDDGWLAELAVVECLPSLMPAVRPAAPQGGPALLLGCTTFGGRAPDLPRAAGCLDTAQRHWPGPVTRLEGGAASRGRLLAEAQARGLRRYRLLHVASHAEAGLHSGLLAHIKLADDDLLVDDVVRLGLDGALVVLAVCEGAASEVLPGDELIGLSRAFVMAGADQVVASLWPIFDQSALLLVDHFYAALRERGDPAGALATAQRRLIGPEKGEAALAGLLATPYIWGCFGVTSAGVARR